MSDVRIMKKIILQIYNNLQVLWSSKVKFVSLSQLLRFPLFESKFGLFTVPGFIVSPPLGYGCALGAFLDVHSLWCLWSQVSPSSTLPGGCLWSQAPPQGVYSTPTPHALDLGSMPPHSPTGAPSGWLGGEETGAAAAGEFPKLPPGGSSSF